MSCCPMPRLKLSCGLLAAALLTTGSAYKVAAQSNLPPVIAVTDATNYLNKVVSVTDTVVQVALRPTVALLNLNQKYPDAPLTLIIRGNDTNKFPFLESYLGRRVTVTGRIFSYQGRPEIALTSTDQIRVLNPAEESLKVTAPLVTPLPVTPPVLPTSTVPTNPPPSVPATAKPDRAVGWIIGSFAATVLLLGSLIILVWRRAARRSNAAVTASSFTMATAPVGEQMEPLSAGDWKQRALVAEAMAGRQGQVLREKLMPELAEFAKQSLVQGLYAQRNALLETQQAAQRALVELEARLAALQLPLPKRIRAYERRIAELEKEVETQGDEMRELTRATLVLVRKKLEDERQRERAPSRFN